MKIRILTILIVLMLISGLSFVLFPIVSNWVSMNFRDLEIADYTEAVELMDPDYIAAEMEKARNYNGALTGYINEDPFIPGSGIVLPDNYTSVLNIDGVIGYINIPKVNIYLPIKHGTIDEVLKNSVGHLENTAFPIGGDGSHSVLTGHTGLPFAKIFTDLVELENGDIFYVTVLNETLAYKVDQILVVTPDDTKELHAVNDKDYVTLVTCTPYGINSHRLFVRGERAPELEGNPTERPEGIVSILGWRTVIIAACIFILLIVFVIIAFRIRRKKREST